MAKLWSMSACAWLAVAVATISSACTFDFGKFEAPASASAARGDDGAEAGVPSERDAASAAAREATPDAAGQVEGGAPDADASGERGDASDAPPPATSDASTPGTCDAPGLVARWRFDEGVGGIVHDCTSTPIDGTIVGASRWGAGHVGTDLELDGSYVNFGNAPRARLQGGLTVTAWIRVATAPAQGSSYVLGKTDNIRTSGWRLAIEPQALSFQVARGMNRDGIIAYATFNTLGVWTHVAGVFTPGVGVSVYVNGALAGTATDAPPNGIVEVGQDLRLGVRGDSNFDTFYRGGVDDVRIYDHALPPSEIAAIAAE